MAGANQIAEAKNNHADSQTVQANVDSFKITEIGSVPTDWQVISIEDALRSGAILDQMDGNHGELYPKSHEFSSFGIPYIGATDFDSGRVNYKTCKFIPEKRAKKFRKGIAKNGDVLFAHNATVGPVALLKTDLEYVILSTTATYYRCNLKVLNNYYLSKFFESSFFVDQYTSVMSQSTRNQVPILAQRKFFIAVPGIEEQTAIANALSGIDALINSLEKLIAKKQAIKTATMQQLLTGKTRLPQFATHPDGTPKGYKQSELGEIPEDWEVVQLRDVTWFQEGPGVRQNQFTANGIKLLNGTNIEKERLVLEKTQRYISEKLAYGQYSHFMIDDGDVLIACSGVSIERFDEKVTIASQEHLPLCLNTSTMRFKPKEDKINRVFFTSFLKSDGFKSQIGGKATGSAQLNFGPYHVNQVKIALPTLDEQVELAFHLSDVDSEMDVLEMRLNKTRQLKQGMMQELLTGKIRLVKPAGSAA